MVWGGICHDGRSHLKIVQGTMNAVKYREDILYPIVLSVLQQRNVGHAFQHDNATSHVARVLYWPTLSQDLSPIEHVWDELGRGFHHRQSRPETLQEQRDALVHEWNNIPQTFIQQLIGSMHRKCEAVVAARGGYTC